MAKVLNYKSINCCKFLWECPFNYPNYTVPTLHKAKVYKLVHDKINTDTNMYTVFKCTKKIFLPKVAACTSQPR